MSDQDVTNEGVAEIISSEDIQTGFETAMVIPGLEHLGRAIVDKSGVPSGSPANYEALRGSEQQGPSKEFVDSVIAKIAAEFGDVGK